LRAPLIQWRVDRQLPQSQCSPSARLLSWNRTIACNDSVVTISGITNRIVLTGHCASLTVVGSQNVVTVDTADSIDASGIENQITFHPDSPNVQNSGISNVVQQG
jgi:hypothetical protein